MKSYDKHKQAMAGELTFLASESRPINFIFRVVPLKSSTRHPPLDLLGLEHVYGLVAIAPMAPRAVTMGAPIAPVLKALVWQVQGKNARRGLERWTLKLCEVELALSQPVVF
jgi:hypothetical protein